jgi:hypothetical protein
MSEFFLPDVGRDDRVTRAEMRKQPRRDPSLAFKAKVALAAMKSEKMLAELAE